MFNAVLLPLPYFIRKRAALQNADECSSTCSGLNLRE